MMSKTLFDLHFSRTDRRSIDRAMMLMSVLQPLTAIPQAIEIYSNQSATNVSLVTWLSFTLIGIIFSMYAITHRIKPMIINQAVWFIIDIAIVIGIIIYG